MGIGSAKPATPIINKLRQFYSRFDLLQERKHVLRFYLLGDCSTDINYWHRQPIQMRDNKLGAIDKFIDSENQKLMLMLGDAGSGKSALTHWIVNYFCKNGSDNSYPGFVPIRIELKAYDHESAKDAIEQALKTLFHLNAQEIEELRQMPDVVFLLDGYDEIAGHTKLDIYRENKCHERWQNAKVIITCRNGHFKDEAECKEQFHIAAYKYDNQSLNSNYADLLYLAPFNEKQIEQYLDKFVSSSSNSVVPTLDIEQAKLLIREHENLKAVIQNPFVLQIFAETFPNLSKRYGNEINKIVMSDIYEQFLGDWFIHAKERLQESINLTEIGKKVIDLKKCFYNYAQAFGYTLFAEDKVEITYTPIDSEDEFEIQEYTGHKAFEHFFKNNDANRESQKLLDAKRAACPLRRNIKDVYSFIHKSFQDYLAANYLFTLIYDRYRNIKEQQNKDKSVFKKILNNFNHANHKKLIYVLDTLNKRYLTEERLVLGFLAERLDKLAFEEKEALSEDLLLPMIQYSAKDKNYAKAASSIISVVSAAKVTMSGWDLREVSIPKADLSRAILHRANFTNADLREVRINQVYMAQTNFTHSQMKDVQFGELPYLKFDKQVICLNYSSDGKILAVGQDKEIVIIEVITGKQLHILRGHSGIVTSIAFNNNCTLLVSGSNDKTVRIWDVTSGNLLQVLSGHSGIVCSVAFSIDGTKVASGSYDKNVRLWDARNGEAINVLQGHTDIVNSIAFNLDGTMLASGGEDMSIRLWDVKSGKESQVIKSHSRTVTCVAFSRDGNKIASGSYDKTIRLWNVNNGNFIQHFQGNHGEISSIAFSPNGTILALGSVDTSIWLWDIKSGKELQVLQGHENIVSSLSFSQDSTKLVSGSLDNSVRFWEVKSDKVLHLQKGHINNVYSIAYSNDGTKLASGSRDKSVCLWDVKSGKVLQLLKGHNGSIFSIAFSYDDKILASGSDDHGVKLWEVNSGKVLHRLHGHKESVYSVVFSPDSTKLASGSWDTSVRLWDVKSGSVLQVLIGHDACVLSLAFSPDGAMLASGGDDKKVLVWDVKTRKRLKILSGYGVGVKKLMFSPNSAMLASAGDDSSVRLWNLKNSSVLKELHGFIVGVKSITFSPDCTKLVLGSDDKTIRIWDIDSNQCIAVIANGAPVLSLSYSRYGQLISGDGSPNNAVRLWQLINNQWHLKWSSPQQTLCMVGCIIDDVKDLSDSNKSLIKQRLSEIKVLPTNIVNKVPFKQSKECSQQLPVIIAESKSLLPDSKSPKEKDAIMSIPLNEALERTREHTSSVTNTLLQHTNPPVIYTLYPIPEVLQFPALHLPLRREIQSCPLLLAIAENNLPKNPAELNELLKKDQKDSKNNNAVHYAAFYGNTHIMPALIQAGFNILKQNKNKSEQNNDDVGDKTGDKTRLIPIHLAIFANQFKWFKENYARYSGLKIPATAVVPLPNLKNSKTQVQLNAFHFAIVLGREAFVGECLARNKEQDNNKKITINLQVEGLGNVLHLAILAEQPVILRMLLNHILDSEGAQLLNQTTHPDFGSLNALSFAAAKTHVFCLRELLNQYWRRSTYQQMRAEQTKEALCQAIRHGAFQAVKTLMADNPQLVSQGFIPPGSVEKFLMLPQAYANNLKNNEKDSTKKDNLKKIDRFLQSQHMDLEEYRISDINETRIDNLVFCGGGVKGIALAGAYKEFVHCLDELSNKAITDSIKETHRIQNLKRVAGTSSGAIFATLVALDFKPDQISDILWKMDFNKFMDSGFADEKSPDPRVLSQIREKVKNFISDSLTIVSNPKALIQGWLGQKGLCEGEYFRQWFIYQLSEHLTAIKDAEKERNPQTQSEVFKVLNKLAQQNILDVKKIDNNQINALISHGRGRFTNLRDDVRRLEGFDLQQYWERFLSHEINHAKNQEVIKLIESFPHKQVINAEIFTFEDLANLIRADHTRFRHLHIFTTKINSEGQPNEIVRIDSELEYNKDYLVADAVRCSMSIPLIYQPHKLYRLLDNKRQAVGEHHYLDGGVLKNYAVEAFDFLRYQPNLSDGNLDYRVPNNYTRGFHLYTPNSNENDIKTLMQKLLKGIQDNIGVIHIATQLYEIYYNAEDLIAQFEGTRVDRTIELSNCRIDTTDFDLPKEKKEELYNKARESVRQAFGLPTKTTEVTYSPKS